MNPVTDGGPCVRSFEFAAALIMLCASETDMRAGVAKTAPGIAIADDRVFIADAVRGRVLEGTVTVPGRTLLSSLTPVSGTSGIRSPVALDVRRSQLVVIDAAGPAVLDINLVTSERRVLMAGPPLREPTSVAIAANGTVVVADPAARAVFLLHPTKEMQIDRRFEVPLEVHFDPDDGLYVYDGGRGLIRLDYVDLDTFTRKSDRPTAAPLLGLARVLSFAPRRGLLYVADESGLRVAVLSGRLTLRTSPHLDRRRLSRIAVNQQFIIGIDDAGSALEAFERPLPVSVTLDPTVSGSNAATLELLEYLAERRLLATRVVALEQSDEPYERVLARYKLLTARDGSVPDIDRGRVRNLFCSLNPVRCASGAPPPERDNAEVIIPQLTVESQLSTSRVALNGKTVRASIDERVLDPDQRAAVTTDSLTRLNPVAEDTLDAELRRRNLIMATPMSDQLSAGSVLRIDGSVERKVGDLASRCGVSPERLETSTFLPEITRTTTFSALPAAVERAEKLRLRTDVQLGFDRVIREAIPVVPIRGCKVSNDTSKDKEYVVTESLRVDHLRYRIPELEGRGGGRGTQQYSKQSTFDERGWRVVPGPFYVAYKAVEFARVSVDFGERTVNPGMVKPARDAESLWSRTQGDVILPATRWRFDVLVPAPDYASEGSTLDKIRHRYSSLALSSHERVRASARSAFSRLTGVQPSANVKSRLEEARKKLTSTISHFDDLAAGTEDAYVGIGESDDQVNQDHPGFIFGGRSAWFEATAQGLARRRVPASPAAAGQVNVHKLGQTEHGTHVAGIIAARTDTLMPGLAPVANLFLVDTAKALEDTIQEAYDLDIRIFNFSFALDASRNDAHTLGELHDRLVNHWQSSLFIVAAGNEGTDLNARGAAPLISWVLEAPNVLGVGAATANGALILPNQPDPDDPAGGNLKGSNFGSKFVQLIAPGEQIYSLGNEQYAYASGTSQAVPQVSAAAAMLWARGTREPLRMKARLIATSDWQDQYRRHVWGGLLNVQRAVRHTDRNILRTQSASDTVWAITIEGGLSITAKNVRTYQPDGTEVLVATKIIPVRKIVRLNHLGASNFRIIALDNTDRLTIMFGRLEGRIDCADAKVLDPATGLFRTPKTEDGNVCGSGSIPVAQLEDYVVKAAAIPVSVKF